MSYIKNVNDTYVSPAIIVDLFNKERAEVGDEILTSRKYQKLREGWIAACHVVAVSESHREEVRWLLPNPVAHSMPDYYAFRKRGIEGETYKEGVNEEVEVFERLNNDTDLFSAIEKKVKNWRAPKTSIICYSWLPQGIIHLARVHQALKRLSPDVLEIFVLTNFGQRGHLTSVQVYPRMFAMRVPKKLPKTYYEPYQFVSKKRALQDSDGGVYKINEEMVISKVSD